jgi:cytochrome b6-f complex iron-sulfur subunit
MKNDSETIRLQSRREFCAGACEAATVAVAAVWLSSCGGPTSPSDDPTTLLPSVGASVAGRTVSVMLDSASALAAVGGAGLVQTSLGSFLIARTSQDAYTVLTAVCTHEGCTVTGFADSRYVCPCHGSQYTTAGLVTNGPAPRPLTQYASQVANGVLTFAV